MQRGVSASFGQINLNGSDKNNYSLFYIEHISDCYGVYTTALNGVERDLDIFVNKAQFSWDKAPTLPIPKE